jgi:hypothetical protein
METTFTGFIIREERLNNNGSRGNRRMADYFQVGFLGTYQNLCPIDIATFTPDYSIATYGWGTLASVTDGYWEDILSLQVVSIDIGISIIDTHPRYDIPIHSNPGVSFTASIEWEFGTGS